MKLNKTVDFFTDTATLAIFDPAVLAHRKDDTDYWFVEDFATVPEVATGLIALVSLANDGFYDIRVTDELSEDEKNFAREVTANLGFVSKSGHIFIGKGEFLPGDGMMPTLEDLESPDSAGVGTFIDFPVGEYDLRAYTIDASGYVSEEMARSLPQVVVVITKRIGEFKPIQAAPMINEGVDTFLFPCDKNQKKLPPAMGKILTGVVFKTARTPSGLAIKEKQERWPDTYARYEIILKDMTQVAWQDRIKFKTLEFDPEKKIIYAELIEKIPNK